MIYVYIYFIIIKIKCNEQVNNFKMNLWLTQRRLQISYLEFLCSKTIYPVLYTGWVVIDLVDGQILSHVKSNQAVLNFVFLNF